MSPDFAGGGTPVLFGGDEAGFTAYLADLRHRHRRKTSFITRLDKDGPRP